MKNPEIEPVAKVLSSKGDVLAVDAESAEILFFEDEKLPPCLAIHEKGHDWEKTRALFINDVDLLGNLCKLGIASYLKSEPNEFYVESYTDPENDSDKIEWQLAGFKNTEHDEATVDYADIDVPELDSEPFLTLSIEGKEVELSYANCHLVSVYDDDSMDHIVAVWDDGEIQRKMTWFLEDIEDPDLLETLTDMTKMRVLSFPKPTPEIAEQFFSRKIGDSFDIEEELDYLNQGYFDEDPED